MCKKRHGPIEGLTFPNLSDFFLAKLDQAVEFSSLQTVFDNHCNSTWEDLLNSIPDDESWNGHCLLTSKQRHLKRLLEEERGVNPGLQDLHTPPQPLELKHETIDQKS